MSPRQRPIIYAAAAIIAAWAVAMAGYAIARHSKMTPEKLRACMQTTDLGKLTGSARAQALSDLADKINRLTPEERRQARIGRLWAGWFEAMTEDEKSVFLDATLPSGFKQAISGFEKLPQEKRQKALDTAIKRLREARENPDLANSGPGSFSGTNNPVSGTNAPSVLSEDLQKKIVMTGLKTFYTQSSAQSKAELAPLLEEIQKTMQAGRLFRNR
jgi:hypothetical protein